MERRRRAPRRAGRRTTLTVPARVLDAAECLAAELGTSVNDAIIRLAEEGGAARERRERIAAVAAKRLAAIERGVADASGFPTSAEVRAAMLSGRRDG